MNKSKAIFTTLPYVNSKPHIGHCFEFVIADIIARFHRLHSDVFFNVGIDEHGIKVQQAAEKEGITPKRYCDNLAIVWNDFCEDFQISYDNFYRTSSATHAKLTKDYFANIFNPEYISIEEYEGKYCSGCECFITEKEIIDNKCPIHKTELQTLKENNWFLNLAYFRDKIKDTLVDKRLSKELKNIIESFDKISITRENIKWGVPFSTNVSTIFKNVTFYVWFEALLSYIFSAGWRIWPKDNVNPSFYHNWENSLIICGQDNLKFQSYILPAILAAGGISQPDVLVHGTILDEKGDKMSKTVGNVIDPIEQLEKFGVSPVRFYLFCGLNIFESSSYSEQGLKNLWNSQIVDNFGNLIARTLHLIDIKGIEISEGFLEYPFMSELIKKEKILEDLFSGFNFTDFKNNLFKFISDLNKRFNDEKPFDKNLDIHKLWKILNEIYYELKTYSEYISLIIPEYKKQLEEAFKNKKKVILFKKLL